MTVKIKIRRTGESMENRKFKLNNVSIRLNTEKKLYSEEYITSPENAILAFKNILNNNEKEVLLIAYLNTRGQPINVDVFDADILNPTSFEAINLKEIFDTAVLSNAYSIISLSNRADMIIGNTFNTKEKNIIQELKSNCSIMGIEFLDHLVLRENSYISAKDEQLLDSILYPDFTQTMFNSIDKNINNNSFSKSFIELHNEKPLYSNSPITKDEMILLVHKLIHAYDREAFVIANLNEENKPVNISVAGLGTLNAAMVHPREILKSTILSKASSIILFHNHPSNNASPSVEDINTTKTIKKACSLIGVKLLDHIIIAQDHYCSINKYPDIQNIKDIKSISKNITEHKLFDNTSKYSHKSSQLEKVLDSRKELVKKIIDNLTNKNYIIDPNIYQHLKSPYNPVSGVTYKGGNKLKLMIIAAQENYNDPRWCTYNQAKENGWHVKPGERGILCEKFIFEKEEIKRDENGKILLDKNGNPEKEIIKLNPPIANYFYVFNATQIENIPELKIQNFTYDETIKIAEKFIRSSECPITEKMCNNAYYSPKEDCIVLPPKNTFISNEHFLSTSLHEMAHSTGHPDRLNRPLMNKFGSEEYALEELNAEISTIFIRSDLNIDLDMSSVFKHNIGYIASWIRVLNNDPNALFRACSEANKISNYLISNYEKSLTLSKEGFIEKITGELKQNDFKSTKTILENISKLALNSDENIKNINLKSICTEYKNLSKSLKSGVIDKNNISEYQKTIINIGTALKNQELKKLEIQKENKELFLER